MRLCSKPGCSEPAEATMILSYEGRRVVLSNLLPEHDRNHVELCMRHADRLRPPVGWEIRDDRTLRWLTTAF